MPIKFPALAIAMKADLDKWLKGNYSWFGCCAIVQMSIFMRPLYLLQVLSIKIPLMILKEFSRSFSHFIWAHRPPHLSFAILRLPKSSGDIAVPDVIRYYHACHLARAVAWCKQDVQKQWIQVEQTAVPFPLSGLPWCVDRFPPVGQDTSHDSGNMGNL